MGSPRRLLVVLVAALAVLGFAWLTTRNADRPSGSWAVTNEGCLVPVGQPRTKPPGPVCGTREAVTFCLYQGQRYGIGEQFAAADACNTCACDVGGKVVCSSFAQCENTNR